MIRLLMRGTILGGVMLGTLMLTRPTSDLTGLAPSVVVKAEAAGAQQTGSTQGDQVDLALTVYNSNIALVRDVRRITLPAGLSALHFVDIAATVNPATVHFRSLDQPDLVRVLEQNYEYDLLEPAKLLQKYVGRDVVLVRTRQQNGTTTTEDVRARLLAFNNGPVWQIGDEIVTGLGADHLRFPELPQNLYSRPTLVWSLDNGGGTRHRVETAYLAGSLTWNADYVLTVGRDHDSAELDGWVTLVNNSGTAYENTRLQLVAGDLNRMADSLGRAAMETAQRVAAAPASFAEEAFAEYHLYTLDRRTSVMDKQTKQVSLLSGAAVPVKKRFIVDGQQMYYRNRQHPGAPLKDRVKVVFTFANEEASGLGLPMPAGTVRVYQADSNGNVQFAGEDRIDHTPKNERLDIEIGRAFDVVAERRQTDFVRLSDRLYELAFELTVRNHKPEPIVVEVNEPFGGEWRILEASHDWTKADAWAATFNVPADAEADSTLRYRVRVEW